MEADTAATPEALLRKYAEGDDAAFEALVGEIGERLFAFVCRYMGDHHRAEDLYQTVLIRVARKAKSYQQRARVTTWIYTIARNACLDALRAESRRPSVSLDQTEERLLGVGSGALPADTPPADRTAQAEELGEAIRRAVRKLPDEQREVFLLKEEGELTFEEIAGIVGCNRETAKSRMRYALERLRNALKREARQHGL